MNAQDESAAQAAKAPSNDVKPESKEQEQKRAITPEQFVTNWPLYTPASIENFYVPPRISFRCDHPKCAKETTWAVANVPQEIGIPDVSLSFKWVWYTCGYCQARHLLVVYREAGWEQRKVKASVPVSLSARGTASVPTRTVAVKFQKIGQYPAQSIDVPPGLLRNLGEEGVSLYKKGLINRNIGYGLGALTYIRRVVEDKTNELIEVAAQLAESHHVDPKVTEFIDPPKS